MRVRGGRDRSEETPERTIPAASRPATAGGEDSGDEQDHHAGEDDERLVELEDASGLVAVRRSVELVRGRWIRVGSLVGLGAFIALAAGPLLGALLIFASNSSLALLNLVSGVVYAITLPFVALVTSYVYFDARVRHEVEPADARTELPAEIALPSTGS